MAELTAQTIDREGVTPSYTAASSGGDTFENSGKPKFIHVKNGDASPHTVTVASQVDDAPAGTSKSDVSVTVAAGGEEMIGPFPKTAYSNNTGECEITYDAVTSVTIAVLTLNIE